MGVVGSGVRGDSRQLAGLAPSSMCGCHSSVLDEDDGTRPEAAPLICAASAPQDCSWPLPKEEVQALETLAYTPVRFENSGTTDNARSYQRYEQTMLTGAKPTPRWMTEVVRGRPVFLFVPCCDVGDREFHSFSPRIHSDVDGDGEETMVPAMLSMDTFVTKVTITPMQSQKYCDLTTTIFVNRIETICPAMYFQTYLENMSSMLTDWEKGRAVLIQYKSSEGGLKLTCLLEESKRSRDQFIQAVTAVWLENKCNAGEKTTL
eukprot:NODE_11201_length_1301_cov_11.121806.p1 GENE.NODE_11201_length_1301_cov_11.121806~~NODE_11201_length_1301_cov_11.121806.p1  ORF type:complete len:262 (+),score=54.58 NODE_11201_length_1301_cov_11.121806:130-915(+)